MSDTEVSDTELSNSELSKTAASDPLEDATRPAGNEEAVGARPIELVQSSELSDAAPSDQDLVDEGDIAADYIEELLDISDIDGDIDIDARGGRAYISVSATEGANLRLLSKPDTVTALQELTRLAVQNRTGRFSRLILDIGGSRDARAAELAALVDHAVARIDAGAATASLPPMSSYERKIVHDIVAERGFSSESEGEGRDRHTVISRA